MRAAGCDEMCGIPVDLGQRDPSEDAVLSRRRLEGNDEVGSEWDVSGIWVGSGSGSDRDLIGSGPTGTDTILSNPILLDPI